MLLSTCNRTEVYAHATLFHPAMQDVRDFLSDVSGVDPDEFSDLLYAYHDDAAVAHLFGVAAGLDSMIIGEGEILGQVREAWQAAEREEASGPLLSRTFRHAIEVGKRARTETAIGRHAVSVSSAAVSLANSRLGTLDDRRVLVLGAGEMGEGMALALAGAGVLEIVVANRTMSRGEELAHRVGGRAISLDEVPAALVECDVLLVSTGATDLLMERSQVEQVMERRGGRALLVVDVGVPRNIDPGAGEVFGVDLLDIDDLRALGEQSLAQRRQEIGKVRDLIAEELDRHRLERSAREVAPLVTALRARAEELRTLELERHRSKLAALDPAAARGDRRDHPGRREQAVARADDPREGRRRHRSWRALRRRAGRAVRSAGASRRPRRVMQERCGSLAEARTVSGATCCARRGRRERVASSSSVATSSW